MRPTHSQAAAAMIIVLVMQPISLAAQEASFDTLSYFSPTDTLDNVVWIGAIDSFAVKFTPDSMIEYFDIQEIHFFVHPKVTAQLSVDKSI